MCNNVYMIRTQIMLPEEQLKMLKQVAFREEISLGELFRRTMQQKYALKPKASKKPGNFGIELKKLADYAQKHGAKGPKDLSKNVDKYLYGRL